MIVRRTSDLEVTETPGRNYSSAIATPRGGATEVSVIRQRKLQSGNNPLHSHDQEEVLVLLAGDVTVVVQDQSVTLSAGDSVIVPAHTQHQLINTGSEPAEWLIIAPSGVRFFNADGEEVHPDWAR